MFFMESLPRHRSIEYHDGLRLVSGLLIAVDYFKVFLNLCPGRRYSKQIESE